MEDQEIVSLYWERDEAAIAETSRKYGALCHRVAKNILAAKEDAEECVCDVYRRAWDSIPPQRPENLGAWLCRVTRNQAVDLYRKNHAKKRDRSLETLLDELEECLPASGTAEETLEAKELTGLLNRWLEGISPESRSLFLARYFLGEPVKELAKKRSVSPGKAAQALYRLRQDLKKHLEKEGYPL